MSDQKGQRIGRRSFVDRNYMCVEHLGDLRGVGEWSKIVSRYVDGSPSRVKIEGRVPESFLFLSVLRDILFDISLRVSGIEDGCGVGWQVREVRGVGNKARVFIYDRIVGQRVVMSVQVTVFRYSSMYYGVNFYFGEGASLIGLHSLWSITIKRAFLARAWDVGKDLHDRGDFIGSGISYIEEYRKSDDYYFMIVRLDRYSMVDQSIITMCHPLLFLSYVPYPEVKTFFSSYFDNFFMKYKLLFCSANADMDLRDFRWRYREGKGHEFLFLVVSSTPYNILVSDLKVSSCFNDLTHSVSRLFLGEKVEARVVVQSPYAYYKVESKKSFPLVRTLE